MTAEEYWAFVDAARPANNDADKHCAALTKALGKLPAAEIVDYERLFSGFVAAAYRADLWSAVYQINGGCSDDGFVYFRWWLAGQGRDVYELAVADPESLIEIVGASGDELEHESYGYVALHAYQKVTGADDMPYDFPTERAPSFNARLRGRWVRSVGGMRRKWPTMWRVLHKPPVIDPAWLSANNGTAAAVTRAVHGGCRWGDLPVLADALQEGGCEDVFLLGHLRAGRPHARHCWATRLLTRAGA